MLLTVYAFHKNMTLVETELLLFSTQEMHRV